MKNLTILSKGEMSEDWGPRKIKTTLIILYANSFCMEGKNTYLELFNED